MSIKEWENAPGVTADGAWPKVAQWTLGDDTEWLAVASPTELRVFKKDGGRWRRVDDAEQGQPL